MPQTFPCKSCTHKRAILRTIGRRAVKLSVLVRVANIGTRQQLQHHLDALIEWGIVERVEGGYRRARK